MLSRLAPFACLAFLCVLAYPAGAQSGPGKDVSALDIIEAAEQTKQLQQEQEETALERVRVPSSPLSTLLQLRELIRRGDWKASATYLDTRYLPEAAKNLSDRELAWTLRHVFAQHNIVDLGGISDEPEGDTGDGLPGYRDKIGVITLSSEKIPIYLQRVRDESGYPVWKVSNITVARIPDMWAELGYGPIAQQLVDLLPDFQFMGMENWQFFATAVSLLASWGLAMLSSYLLLRLAMLFPQYFSTSIRVFFRGPARFFLFIQIARFMLDQLGLSLATRILLKSSGVGYLAWLVLILGLISLFRDYEIRKMRLAGNAQYVSLLKPFTTIVKVVVSTVIFLFWANTAGYDMSTILAGLGVGSLAVALAAQKTLENVFGAVILYAAKPVRVGEFCRFGTKLGVVEDIGLRSTLIRTLDRTLLAIPNAVFSSAEIENYSRRDRYRFCQRLRVEIASDEQMRFLLAELRRLFLSHPKLQQDLVSVRLAGIEDATCVLRLEARIDTNDFQEFLEVGEDLNLRIIRVVSEAGLEFCGRGSSVLLVGGSEESVEQRAVGEQAVLEWRESGRLPFPNFSSDELAALRNALDYPPMGSSQAR